MKFYIITLLLSSLVVLSYGQDEPVIRKRALLLAISDFTDYSFINSSSIINTDSLVNSFQIADLRSDYVYDCSFFLIRASVFGCDCGYYIAYEKTSRRFYKLSGFRNSEFAEFYNRVLLGGGISFPKSIKKKKLRRKYIVKNVRIDGVNLKDYYQRYYLNERNGLSDSSSCYRKSIINKY